MEIKIKTQKTKLTVIWDDKSFSYYKTIEEMIKGISGELNKKWKT